jgi:UDP-glucuronate 4-epimerase
VGAIFDTSTCSIYNLGSHRPYSILELIECIEDYFHKKAPINFIEGPKGDVQQTFASITQAQHHLGFYPKTSLKAGMNLFLDWYSSYYIRN